MNKKQMELEFNTAITTRFTTPKQRRLSRSQWWFRQMRKVVDCAFDWSAAPSARPAQIYLTLSPRRI
ncbi:MAG: hypothetical protein M3Y82_10015 [Verrucomicrobiota bacterium]|nr:hypothetical protein [Verrucomicrobiota bacterium]